MTVADRYAVISLHFSSSLLYLNFLIHSLHLHSHGMAVWKGPLEVILSKCPAQGRQCRGLPRIMSSWLLNISTMFGNNLLQCSDPLVLKSVFSCVQTMCLLPLVLSLVMPVVFTNCRINITNINFSWNENADNSRFPYAYGWSKSASIPPGESFPSLLIYT